MFSLVIRCEGFKDKNKNYQLKESEKSLWKRWYFTRASHSFMPWQGLECREEELPEQDIEGTKEKWKQNPEKQHDREAMRILVSLGHSVPIRSDVYVTASSLLLLLPCSTISNPSYAPLWEKVSQMQPFLCVLPKHHPHFSWLRQWNANTLTQYPRPSITPFFLLSQKICPEHNYIM